MPFNCRGIDMYLHGFERRIVPDHSKLSLIGATVCAISQFLCWLSLANQKAHHKHWLFSVLTKWVVFCIVHCIMQSAMPTVHRCIIVGNLYHPPSKPPQSWFLTTQLCLTVSWMAKVYYSHASNCIQLIELPRQTDFFRRKFFQRWLLRVWYGHMTCMMKRHYWGNGL